MKIFAKNTEVKSIDEETASVFIESNHLQKTAQVSTKLKNCGLFYDGELVGVAQFCAPRTAKKQREYSTELLRLAFKKDIRVVGGASKLIKYFIDTYNPADIFTYQDATGENTKVYEHAGFTFVSQEKKKEYLVAPGKTLETGSRKEVLGMPYATQYGPDRILGTKLGEVIDETTGKRKSNKRIFVEDLGWHVESTPGDKVFEWFNPNMTHYVYKITATDSDKYYYGVSHVKKANATIEDCLNDGYYGSGGVKFQNWKKKHKDTLVKEIVEIDNSKSKMYEKEANLIDLNDRNILNSSIGGYRKSVNVNLAPIIKLCDVHGESKHFGESCMKCVSDVNVSILPCPTHGESKHIGKVCMKCSANDSYNLKNCIQHGKSKHRGDTCMKCVSESSYSMKDCIVHGIAKHVGESCSTCNAEKASQVNECEIHGETNFYGEQCVNCRVEQSISVKVCVIHGESKHIGGKCYQCRESSAVLKNCNIHGESYHNGDNCLKCNISDNTVFKDCEMNKNHTNAQHINGVCVLCRSQKAINIGNCQYHGETKFRGKSCAKCNAEKAAHNSTHLSDPRGYCRLCVKDFDIEPTVLKPKNIQVCELCSIEFEAKHSRQRFCSNPHIVNCAVCGKENETVPRKGKKDYVCFTGSCRKKFSEMKLIDTV